MNRSRITPSIQTQARQVIEITVVSLALAGTVGFANLAQAQTAPEQGQYQAALERMMSEAAQSRCPEDLMAHSCLSLGEQERDSRWRFVRGDDAATFDLFELYADEAAVAAHRASAHYQAFREQIGDWLAAPVDVRSAAALDLAPFNT